MYNAVASHASLSNPKCCHTYRSFLAQRFCTFLLVLVFSLISLSCGNLFSPNDSDSATGTNSFNANPDNTNSQVAVIFRGTVAYSGAIPSEIATSDSLSGSSRQSDNLSSSAVPVFNTDDYEYFARAVEIDSTGNAVTDGAHSTGTFSDSSAPVFEISLATGKIWKITCGVKKKPASADDPFNQNDVCLEASFDNDGNPLTASSPVITRTFYPTPVSGGTGSLHLSMNVPNSITSVTTECISATPATIKDSWASAVSSSSTTMLTASNLPSGIYEVAIKFYKTHETFGSYLVYSTVQSINVIKGMQTNTWVSDGTSLFTTSGSTTTFNLTDDIINNYLSTQLYVGKPAGLASRTDVLATDTNAGSAYSPLATLGAALNRIESVGKSTETYTIHVSGEITGTATLSSSLDTKAKSIIIEGLQGSSTDILNGNSEGTVLTISTTRPVTINNLTLTGGNATNGGGILIDSGAKVTLGNGTVISGNTATNGGAVHLSGEDSALSLKGSACIPYGVTIGGITQTGPGKNDVYLATGKTLSVTGSLNPPALANGTVAAITMQSWNRGATIVTAANGVSFTDSIAEYFTITAPEAGGWEKLIDSSRKKIKVDAPIFIGNSTVAGDDTNNSGTLSSPFKTLARACQEMNDSETDYTIKVIGTTSQVAQEIPASLLNSGSGDSTKNYAHSVTIIGVTESGSGTQAEINRGLASSTSDADGSALAVNSSVPVTLKNLKITGGNTTTNGGGIFISSGATVYVDDDSVIQNNKAEQKGGGIYNQGTLYVKNANIMANTAANGGAIYNLSGDKLSMKGTVNIPYGAAGVTGSGKNDLYLGADSSNVLAKIMLAGALTAPAGGKIATIVPSAYSSGAQILALASGVTDTSIADEYTKFALADETYFAISSTGCLAFAGDPVTEFYVNAVEGRDTNDGATKETAMATITNVLKRITLQGMADQDYTINVIGTLTGAQIIPASDAANNISINAQTAKSITLCGEGLGAELDGGFTSSSNGTTLTISTAQPVTIENLTITGGYATNGSGVYVDTNANVFITEGTKIVENQNTGSGFSYGGGIYTKGTLTLNGATVNKNLAKSGGGVYIDGGKVFIYGNTMIGEDDSAYSEENKLATTSSYGNKAASYGGGIYNDNGLLAIGYSSYTSETDNTPAEFTGKICRNYAGSSSGAITSRATTVMSSGTISYNATSGYSCVTVSNSSGSTFIMNGGSIEHNKAAYGAGLFITEKGNATINGGSISYNTATDSSKGGGGIYKSSSNTATLNLYGVTISNNTADSGKGGAIYMAGNSFNMKGSAYIPYGVDGVTGNGKNDLYLEDGMSVTIAGKLTPPDACSDGIVATIQPQTYSTTTQVLGIADSPSPTTTLAAECRKFGVIPEELDDGGTQNWYVGVDGKLTDSSNIIVPISAEELSDFSPTSSEVYNIIVDSTFGSTEVDNLLSKINGTVGEGTVLDLSNSTATSVTKWLQGRVSSITLPGTISRLPSQFFQNADSLTEINVPASNTTYCSVDGVLYTKDMSGLMKYPASKAGDTFTLPDTVRQLYYEAFDGNKNLVRINGLNQITSFINNNSDAVFAYCEKLEEIDLSGLTVSSLSDYTVRYSSALKKITLSSSITTIGSACFQTLSNLEEVHFLSTTPPNLTSSDSYYRNFKSCPKVKFYVPSSAVDAYKNATGTKGFANPSYNAAASTTEEIQALIFGE